MRVLHLITSTRSFFEEQIAVLEDRGVRCDVLGAPGEYTAESPRTPFDYVRMYRRVLQAVHRNEYDIVHAHYGLIGPLALAQPKRPVIVSLWGTDVMSDSGWLRAVSRLGCNYADATIVPSPAMTDAVPTDYALIPFGVDLNRFRPMSRSRAREHLGWSGEHPVAIFPYDPSRSEKNYDLAERVIAESALDIELRVVTDVPYTEMPYYLNASDVLLVTSHRESGPMTVKEAIACNLPIVSTDVGFVRAVCEGVRNCHVATDRQDLVRGLEAVVADGRASNGRSRVDGLGLDAMGDRLLGLYRRVLEERTGKPVTSGMTADLHGH